MTEDHFHRLERYFLKSRLGYWLLGGSKHFGYHPDPEHPVSPSEAQRLYHELLAQKLQLQPGMHLLDAGSGEGVVSTYLAKHYGCSVDGITMVNFEIAESEKRALKMGIKDKVKYHLMDWTSMSFKDKSFDRVYTTETLSHTYDMRKMLLEFYRVLKDHGRIAFFEYSLADDKKWTQQEMEVLDDVIYGSAMSGLKMIRHGQFEKLLREAGFKDLETENISLNVGPFLKHYRKKYMVPLAYFFIKHLGLRRQSPNITSAAEFVDYGERDLIRYNIYTATK